MPGATHHARIPTWCPYLGRKMATTRCRRGTPSTTCSCQVKVVWLPSSCHQLGCPLESNPDRTTGEWSLGQGPGSGWRGASLEPSRGSGSGSCAGAGGAPPCRVAGGWVVGGWVAGSTCDPLALPYTSGGPQRARTEMGRASATPKNSRQCGRFFTSRGGYGTPARIGRGKTDADGSFAAERAGHGAQLPLRATARPDALHQLSTAVGRRGDASGSNSQCLPGSPAMNSATWASDLTSPAG